MSLLHRGCCAGHQFVWWQLFGSVIRALCGKAFSIFVGNSSSRFGGSMQMFSRPSDNFFFSSLLSITLIYCVVISSPTRLGYRRLGKLECIFSFVYG